MATILLIVIYIAFIGLGIPDSLFSTSWPAIYGEFSLPFSFGGIITILSSGCTAISSLLSARVINKFGTNKVVAFSTALTALALLGFSVSGNFIWLLIFTIPGGFGAGAIDTGLNNYVALHYNALHMNLLHCFYGVGVSLSPYIMSLALSENNLWRNGYKTAFIVQLIITVVTIVSLPLWNKVKKSEIQDDDVPAKTLKISEMLKDPAIRFATLAFIGTCAVECCSGIWCATFLVEARSMATDSAARVAIFFYVGIALGRFVSGLLSSKLSSWRILLFGMLLHIPALLLLVVPSGAIPASIGLFLIGFGNGPTFPNLIHLTPLNFGKDVSQSVIGVEMAASSVSIMLLPPLFGILAQVLSIDIFPYFIGIMFVVMAYSIAMLYKIKKVSRNA